MNGPARSQPWAVALLALWLWAGPGQAAVLLRGTVELIDELKNAPPCCVIDARSEASQRKHPLADALRYRPDLSIIPTASVIVVADRDRDALAAGEALAQKHPGKAIYAVKGGVAAWETVLKSLSRVSSSKAPGAAPGISFVIPHNTCETGTPLQILKSKPKAE
jgi:hypothetical protein